MGGWLVKGLFGVDGSWCRLGQSLGWIPGRISGGRKNRRGWVTLVSRGSSDIFGSSTILGRMKFSGIVTILGTVVQRLMQDA